MQTHSIFQLIQPEEQEKQHCDMCLKDLLKRNCKRHLQSCKHKNNSEDTAGFVIEKTDGAFKDHIKIRIFRFKIPESKAVAEAIVKVSSAVETLINKSLREFNTIKLYLGVKSHLTKEDDERNESKEETPYLRRNPHLISSFQGFQDCNVYDKLQRYEVD